MTGRGADSFPRSRNLAPPLPPGDNTAAAATAKPSHYVIGSLRIKHRRRSLAAQCRGLPPGDRAKTRPLPTRVVYGGEVRFFTAVALEKEATIEPNKRGRFYLSPVGNHTPRSFRVRVDIDGYFRTTKT